jgi:hypothetical protein
MREAQVSKRRVSMTNAYACCWRAVSSMSNVSESNFSEMSGSCWHVSYLVTAYERMPSVTDEQTEARDCSQN